MNPSILIANILTIILITMAAYALHVSESDIKSCMQHTGWTHAHCMQELSR